VKYRYIRARVDGAWLTVTWRLAEHRVFGWWRGRLEGVMPTCPCKLTTPCQENCSCVKPWMSHGCRRCVSHGSKEQLVAKAEYLARVIDSWPDLLAACKRLVKKCQCGGTGMLRILNELYQCGDDACIFARETISTATGAVEQARRVAGCGDETNVEVR
jgi:hypothetical protein